MILGNISNMEDLREISLPTYEDIESIMPLSEGIISGFFKGIINIIKAIYNSIMNFFKSLFKKKDKFSSSSSSSSSDSGGGHIDSISGTLNSVSNRLNKAQHDTEHKYDGFEYDMYEYDMSKSINIIEKSKSFIEKIFKECENNARSMLDNKINKEDIDNIKPQDTYDTDSIRYSLVNCSEYDDNTMTSEEFKDLVVKTIRGRHMRGKNFYEDNKKLFDVFNKTFTNNDIENKFKHPVIEMYNKVIKNIQYIEKESENKSSIDPEYVKYIRGYCKEMTSYYNCFCQCVMGVFESYNTIEEEILKITNDANVYVKKQKEKLKENYTFSYSNVLDIYL